MPQQYPVDANTYAACNNDCKEGLDKTTEESIEELRARLDAMKRMMAERKQNGATDILDPQTYAYNGCGIIDASFLSVVFTVALIVILTVSTYAFYSLYHAILKKFSSHHDEL